MKADSILATIGQTPHIRLSRLFPDSEVWIKCERANPGGSIKDRIGLAMIEAAEREGKMSQEKIFHLKAFGAEVVMTPSDVGTNPISSAKRARPEVATPRSTGYAHPY